MKFLADKRKRKTFLLVTAIVLVFAVLISTCAIYLGDYYHADEGAVFPIESISVSTLESGDMIFQPQDSQAGFIFYPGGKVENTAYYPLMAALSQKGITCILVEMPFNLAVFDINAAEGIQEQYPEIDRWYIGGHSLGGSMAASYLADHIEEFDGLILLGSYSTESFADTDIDVLSIYGSEDQVLNREKYEENKENLPDDFWEFIIDGGCHAYFGMYGAQDGDGIPSISNGEQINITTNKIVEFVARSKISARE